MGVDIHMNIIKDGKIIFPDIFDGRNSEWFNNLQGKGWSYEYNHLPEYTGIPENCPEKIKDDFKKPMSCGYYGFHYMTVGDFKKWYIKYRPDLKAGWASTYDKWRIEHKRYIPECELPQYLGKEYNKEDMHFVEYIDYYECSRWLYKYLNEKDIPNDAYISYYFDH